MSRFTSHQIIEVRKNDAGDQTFKSVVSGEVGAKNVNFELNTTAESSSRGGGFVEEQPSECSVNSSVLTLNAKRPQIVNINSTAFQRGAVGPRAADGRSSMRCPGQIGDSETNKTSELRLSFGKGRLVKCSPFHATSINSSAGGQMTTQRAEVPRHDGQSNCPQFLEKLKSQTVEEGQDVKLTCRVKGGSAVSVRWEKDGQQMNSDRFKTTNSGETFSLEIPQCSMSDAGRYVCVVENADGEARTMASLMIHKGSGQGSKFTPVDVRSSHQTRTQIRTFNLQPMTDVSSNPPPPIKKKPETKTAKPTVVFDREAYSAVEGDALLLSCNFTGFPEPKASWLRGAEVINPSETEKISSTGGVSSLEFSSVKDSDSGTYSCRVENSLGTSSATCQLSVQKLSVLNATDVPSSTQKSNSCDDHQIYDAQNNCKNICDNTTDEAATRSTEHSSDNTTEEAAPRSTKHSCDNMTEEVAPISTKLSSDNTTEEATPRSTKHSSDNTTEEAAPRSTKHSSDNTNDEAAVRSTERSSDNATDEAVPESTKPSLSKTLQGSSTSQYLIPLSASPTRVSTNQTCDEDDDDAFEKLSNDSKPSGHDEPPLIEDLEPENVHVLKGSEVQLIARFSGYPIPEVKWLKGGEFLVQDDRFRVESKPRCTMLTIRDAQTQDTGIYSLILTNEFGQDKQLSSVTVEDKPDPPVGPPAVTSILSDSVVLSWSGCSYDGGSSVLKYKVEICKPGSDLWEVLTDDCQHTTFRVCNLVPNTEYIFRVSAANKHGFSNPGDASEPIVTNGVKVPVVSEDFPFAPRVVPVVKDRKFADYYTVGDIIGKGKFGSVHKCNEKSTNRLFAAKFIRVKTNQRDEVRQEVEVMNELHHPKLLLLWEAFESAKEIILITEHVSGGELMERIINDDYVLTERECVHFMRQICEGVVYIHSRNIIHLDLKPENILCVTPNSNEIKIIDFGLARKYNPAKELRVMFGTAEFVAPEVINYDTINYNTDMWSVGVICYIVLSGLSPFMGDNDKETFVNVSKAQFDFDDEAFDDISDDAKDFISKLLVKEQRKRLGAEESLKHLWLAQDLTYMRAKRLSTVQHKRFIARRKWQKTGHALVALRRMVGLQRLSSSNMDSFRSGSSNSQTDTQSVVSDATEPFSESDGDSGFTSYKTNSLDSKSASTPSKDVEKTTDHKGSETPTSEERHQMTPSQCDASSRDGCDAEAASDDRTPTTLDTNGDLNLDCLSAAKPVVSEDLKKKTSSEMKNSVKLDQSQENRKKIIFAPNLVHESNSRFGNTANKTDDLPFRSTRVNVPNGEKKTELSARRSVGIPSISSIKASDSFFRKSVDQSSVPPSAFRNRGLCVQRSFDLHTTSKLNESFARSFDPTKTGRISEKLTATRKIFENPGVNSAAPKTTVSSTNQVKASNRPLDQRFAAKTNESVIATKKPSTSSSVSSSNPRHSDSTVAARKLAVQQFSTQKNTKPKKSPTFVRKLKNIDVVEGRTAKFEVLVDGNPVPTVTWLKDGKELPAAPEKYKTESNDAGKCSLTVVDCGEDDDAEYGCSASNSLGCIMTKANLYVEPLGELLDSNSLSRSQIQ